MPEWSNGAVSKTVVLFGVPRVRIPFSPLQKEQGVDQRDLHPVLCSKT